MAALSLYYFKYFLFSTQYTYTVSSVSPCSTSLCLLQCYREERTYFHLFCLCLPICKISVKYQQGRIVHCTANCKRKGRNDVLSVLFSSSPCFVPVWVVYVAHCAPLPSPPPCHCCCVDSVELCGCAFFS